MGHIPFMLDFIPPMDIHRSAVAQSSIILESAKIIEEEKKEEKKEEVKAVPSVKFLSPQNSN